MRCALLLVLTGPLLAAPVPKELRKADDKAALVGTWVGTAGDEVRFAFAADGTLRTWYGPNPRNSAMGWTWEITDPKATPKRAKITRAENATSFYDCVYEFTPDGLKFALVLSAGQFPDKVERRSGLEFHAMTREPPAK